MWRNAFHPPKEQTADQGGGGGWNFLCGAQCLLELYVCGAIHLTPPTTTTKTQKTSQ
jgi:hypothetical protein